MRKTSELKFNPVKFTSVGINGSIGTKSIDEFFRSALSQNICYCVRSKAKTIHEIADALGVSPVYVETEADFLAEYGFLKQMQDKYIVNFIISEPTEELLTMQDAMYKKAAELFANELYDELINSGILDDEEIFCSKMMSDSTQEHPHRDMNFLLWSLIPYIAAESGKEVMDTTISFDEAATIRPDGAHNIAYAAVVPDNMKLPDDYVYMRNWCGPYCDTNGALMFWKVDSEWSGQRIEVNQYEHEITTRILSLYQQEEENLLSKEDYAWLSERGYITTWGDYDGYFTTAWQIIVLRSKNIREKLLAIGEKIKEKHKDELNQIKVPYVDAVLNSVPAHLRKVKAYELQFVFNSDGWFLLHCMTALLKNGKLTPPPEEQKKALSTLILMDS